MKITRLYHGSNKGFRTLKVSKKLTITNEESLKEGNGIYCLDNDKLKNSFKFMYEISVPTSEIVDFSKVADCRKYLAKIEKMLRSEGIDLNNIRHSLISDFMNSRMKISDYKFIKDLLENSEATCDIKDYKLDRIRRKYNKIIPAVFRYKDADYQGIVTVIKNVSIATILQRKNG